MPAARKIAAQEERAKALAEVRKALIIPPNYNDSMLTVRGIIAILDKLEAGK